MEEFEVNNDRKGSVILAIIAFLFSGVLLYFAISKYLSTGKMSSDIITTVLAAIIFILFAVALLVTMNSFRIIVKGGSIDATVGKNNSFSFSVHEITKIVFSEKTRSKGRRTMHMEIRVGERSFVVNSYNKGFREMINYIKKNYDNCVIEKKAINDHDYNKLTKFADRVNSKKLVTM